MPTAINLWAGAGGLALSLERSGWTVVAAVDPDADAIETLRRNQARGYLRAAKIVQSDMRQVFARALRPVPQRSPWRLDLLAGGPPCQPFSFGGHRQGFRDPRGRQFREFVRLADALKPRFILFENSAGLVTARTPDGRVGGVLQHIQRSFEKIGYSCRIELLNAADFGAPQRRVGLFIIASRGERLPDFPRPTHSRRDSPPRLPWVTLGVFWGRYPHPTSDHVVRPNARRAAVLSQLVPGTGLRTRGAVEATHPAGHWGYRQDHFVADMTLPSRFIRSAWTADWVRLPDGLRRLTWRECAGLQGFPFDWDFAGASVSRFRQVGNAVQGDLGRALAETLYNAAMTVQRARPFSAEWPASFQERIRRTMRREKRNDGLRRAARGRRDGRNINTTTPKQSATDSGFMKRQLHLWIHADDLEALKRRSELEHEPVACIVRRLVKQYLGTRNSGSTPWPSGSSERPPSDSSK